MASGLGSPQLTTPSGGNGLAFYMCDYGAQLAPPTLTGLSPSSGSTTGGYTVTVSGSGFGTAGSPNVSAVEVGGVSAIDVVVTSATTLTAIFPAATTTMPAGSPGTGAGPEAVVVTLKNGGSVPERQVRVRLRGGKFVLSPIPTVTSVGPYAGLESAPSPVAVHGSGFIGATRVSFGGVAVATFTVKSPDESLVTPPAYWPRRAHRCPKQVLTRVRTPPTTCARSRSW